MKKCMVVLLLLTGGCSVRVGRSVRTPRFRDAPVRSEDVAILLPNDTSDSRCELVADLHASASAGYFHLIVAKLRAEAGELGANAVHIQSMEAPGLAEDFFVALVSGGYGEGDIDADAVALHCGLP